MDRAAFLAREHPFDLPELAERRSDLDALRGQLTSRGYDEAGLIQTLQEDRPRALESGRLPLLRWRLAETEPLALLVRLLYLGLPCVAATAQTTLGPQVVDLLVELGLLGAVDGGLLRPELGVDPIAGMHIVTDLRFEPDPEAARLAGRVMYLGEDSQQLVEVAADLEGRRALELCCGAGAASLAAAARHEEVLGVDLNPRAVNFARFNALLNGVENARFVLGDLYAVAGDRPHDLILANPPFVPTPDSGEVLFRDGGSDGEQVLQRILAGAPERLVEGGACWITTDLVEHRGVSLEARWRGWLADREGWSLVALLEPPRDPGDYALRHLAATGPVDTQQLGRWLEHYASQEIVALRYGLLMLGRHHRARGRVVSVEAAEPLPLGQNLGGRAAALQGRLRELDEAGLPPLRLEAGLGAVPLHASAGLSPGMALPYPIASALAVLSATGATAANLGHWLEEAGFALGEDADATLSVLLEQLYLSGSLSAIAEDDGLSR